jgi:hypothetical protein
MQSPSRTNRGLPVKSGDPHSVSRMMDLISRKAGSNKGVLGIQLDEFCASLHVGGVIGGVSNCLSLQRKKKRCRSSYFTFYSSS